MTVGPVTSFVIENESEADEYLTDLLARPEFRTMDEVTIRAQKYIKNAQLKSYFTNKGTEILKTYRREVTAP